jgi:hypothetical protein
MLAIPPMLWQHHLPCQTMCPSLHRGPFIATCTPASASGVTPCLRLSISLPWWSREKDRIASGIDGIESATSALRPNATRLACKSCPSRLSRNTPASHFRQRRRRDGQHQPANSFTSTPKQAKLGAILVQNPCDSMDEMEDLDVERPKTRPK